MKLKMKMKTKTKIKTNNIKKCVTITLSSLLLLFILTLLPIRGEQGIYNGVIRLHIIANSNSEDDQNMKLFVRDRVLAECSETLVRTESSAKEAVDLLLSDSSAIQNIESAAESAVYDYCQNNNITTIPTISCTVGREHYPCKRYKELCFPQGEYYSLKIVIGNGEGENWWCVMFPPMCFAAAEKTEPKKDEFISVGITSDQYNIISESDSPKYKIRFRIVELIESLFDR